MSEAPLDLDLYRARIAALADRGILVSRSLGFSDSYAIGIKRTLAEAKKIKTISDLRNHPELRFGFSSEFLARGDGWPKLKAFYKLPQEDVRGMEHELAYRGLQSGALAVGSGSAGTSGGGGCGGEPSRLSRIHLPRTTGDVRSACDVTSRTPPLPSSPRR